MKKRIIAIAVMAVMALGVFGLSGCNPKPQNIVSTAMFSKNILELPIKGIASNDQRVYDIELDMNEMFSIINEDESLLARRVNKNIFISQDNCDGTKDYFIIKDLIDVLGGSYAFFGLEGWIDFGINSRQLILMPYHLLDESISSWSLTLDSNVEHITNFCIEEFFDFYNDSGWYDLERGEDYFIINGYIDNERVLALENPNLGSNWRLEFKTPIKFQFKNSNESDITHFVVYYA